MYTVSLVPSYLTGLEITLETIVIQRRVNILLHNLLCLSQIFAIFLFINYVRMYVRYSRSEFLD